jgi:SAM-dependent methyltransferase
VVAAVAAESPVEVLDLETPACDLCGATEHRALYTVRDRRHGYPGEFQLVECTRCSLRYLTPRPTAATIAAWYPTTYKAYRKKSWWLRVADFFEDHVWNAYLRLFLTRSYPTFYFPRHVGDFTVDGRAPRLLDIGCGSGDKLRYIRSKSAWQTFGVDFSPQAVENANASGAGDVRHTTGDRLPFDDDYFDAIMSWHSLEHHFSPKATLTEAARVLRPGGKGIFAVPSGDNLGMRMFRSYWGPLEAPRHLYFFTEQSLTRLMTERGLRVERVFYDFSFYGLFLDQEIFESLEFVVRDRTGVFRYPLQLPLKLLRVGGLLSSAATLPILPLNGLLGRAWRGSNMIVHFTKPAH